MSLIDNVIENAIKYSPQGGRVAVDLFSAETSTQFSVSDAGPGIPVALRERVFDRFSAIRIRCRTGAGWVWPSLKRWRSSTTAA